MRKFKFMLTILFVLLGADLARGRTYYDPFQRGLTPRELKPRGQIQADTRETREKLRQIRIQESRMPRDIRAIAPTFITRPGSARPEVVNYTSRDKVKAIGGGWFWESQGKGWSYGFGYPAEYDLTDPEAVSIRKEEPIVEWWEVSERSRGQRAEWFRSRFGAAMELRSVPQEVPAARQEELRERPSSTQSTTDEQGMRPMDFGPSSGGAGGTPTDIPFTP